MTYDTSLWCSLDKLPNDTIHCNSVTYRPYAILLHTLVMVIIRLHFTSVYAELYKFSIRFVGNWIDYKTYNGDDNLLGRTNFKKFSTTIIIIISWCMKWKYKTFYWLKLYIKSFFFFSLQNYYRSLYRLLLWFSTVYLKKNQILGIWWKLTTTYKTRNIFK